MNASSLHLLHHDFLNRMKLVIRPSFLVTAAIALAAASAMAADSSFTLGVPGAPVLRAGGDASVNAWLSANPNYPAMSIVAPTASGTDGISAQQVAGEDIVRLNASEAGFPIERTKPEYYLGDQIDPPDGVDWPATYNRFLADNTSGFLFDRSNNRVFVTNGGTLRFNWVLTSGKVIEMSYVASASCSGRPRRIYWTDYPYNGPAVNLSGKFVKFFGPEEILTPVYGVYTNSAGGIEQVLTNRVVSGLWLDKSTQMLYAYGQLQGQVVMAYYDTGTYERLLSVQAVEICRPAVNRMKGEIGRALKPDGRGFDTAGLRAQPTYIGASDNRGDYYYQHKGKYSYSPKHDNVYPLRPTVNSPWNMEVYWMETDDMQVDWPFEVDQYACDWPEDATVFVRGDIKGDGGRPVFVPSHYSATLMNYQEPEGHARAVESDGTFKTTGEGYSLLKVTADDNIWFIPIHSVFRSNADYFTLEPEEEVVGKELQLRGGSIAGLAPGFSPVCDPDSPGYVYRASSDPIWNAGIYFDAKPDTASDTNATTSASSTDTNKYDSVVYAVRPGQIEVWWNTTIKEEGMAEAIEIPTLPQTYKMRWPLEGESPQIVIASQRGSAAESLFSHNSAIYLSSGDSSASLASRDYFGDNGGTVTFWFWPESVSSDATDPAALLSLRGSDGTTLSIDAAPPPVGGGAVSLLQLRLAAPEASLAATPVSQSLSVPASAVECNGWISVALRINADSAAISIPANTNVAPATVSGDFSGIISGVDAALGEFDDMPARSGVNVGELLFWNYLLSNAEVQSVRHAADLVGKTGLTGCYTFVKGEDLVVTSTNRRTFTDKVLSLPLNAYECLLETHGPPALVSGVISADANTTPVVYAQNDPDAIGYNPNEEHALIIAGSGGAEAGQASYVAWALRSDLNTDDTSAPGVLVQYVKDGRKTMQWFDVAVTNSLYPELAADCVAGKAFPGPHPIDLLDNPWCAEDYWEEPVETAPAFRDRKGQLWARAAGIATMRLYYRMQDGFAFPSLPASQWPAIGSAIPWLSLLDGKSSSDSVLTAKPAKWTWRVSWPESTPEMEIGRTLTVAASGLPEVWNSGSVGVVWPATDAERDATAVLFDPTVAQVTGFDKSTFDSVATAITELGIKQGAGGNATLRKGRWTFDGLPPNLASRFYLDTTADLSRCIKLEGEMEDNPSGVSLLHVNVLSDAERKTLSELLDDKATDKGKSAWKAAIAALAKAPVLPSPHVAVGPTEDRIEYVPRDHYALFSMGATNYVTIIQNDSTNELMSVAEGDPISMHVIKVIPKYYVGRIVTREDPINLLSQQLSVIYAEAFAGKPDDYIFEWRKCAPHANGSVPDDFEGEYKQKFEPTTGLTRFVIGEQGDTLDNMVNTYYAMRYRAASDSSPSYAAMGYEWSNWTDPPALAEGWVQRVLNNVTPFAQRMRDLVENEAEADISMIAQAGKPYEGDVALNQDNLKEVGLIQLYETILSKAESMSLALGIDNADANKQLQLAVARLADLYTVLGDEAWCDALNPTIGFGANFDNTDMTGFELDYGALSSTLFSFDNQVPTLLDEELALLRGRSGANAPSTRLSPYYNRLVWNFTKGITAGEVAYAVNYDINGNNRGYLDENDAADQYPQGHGDAYGHYLSALSGYYRLLRNPYFTWGEPAMGEMVVADSVLNVDYYDEAKFAKAAYDVAKVASAVVDRTARKAWRDSGGASMSGFLDDESSRAFGYGEWASRGGFGALANWAVGNALLGEAPSSGRYWRFFFTGDSDDDISTTLPETIEGGISASNAWTLEFQLVPSTTDSVTAGGADESTVLCLTTETRRLSVLRDNESGDLSAAIYAVAPVTNVIHGHYWFYTNVLDSAEDEADEKDAFSIERRIGNDFYECLFAGSGAPPTDFPEGYDMADFATNPPEFSGWACVFPFDIIDEEDGETYHYPGIINYEDEEVTYEISGEPLVTATIGNAPENANTLVALRCSEYGTCQAVVINATGAVISTTNLNLPMGFSLPLANASVALGGGFTGEIAEIRAWTGVARTDSELREKREFVSPLSENLAFYVRPIANAQTTTLIDEKVTALRWNVNCGAWIAAESSGVNITFEDEGLSRIDRATVPELASLASMIPDIQKKVDRIDAGLTPIGLASGAIPFDLTPIAPGEDGHTHYEQIRERAGTALANARRALDKAQFYGSRLRMLYESQVSRENQLETMELETKNALIEYFGYPYEGDIGPGGTYPQGYDGPDLINYAWMEPWQFGLDADEDIKSITTNLYVRDASKFRDGLAILIPNLGKTVDFDTLTYEKSATGIILKPAKITGKRRACGKIQDALGELLVAYRGFKSCLSDWEKANTYFEYEIGSIRLETGFHTAKQAASAAKYAYEAFAAVEEAALKTGINSVEAIMKLSEDAQSAIYKATPSIVGAGMTVNTDPSAMVAAAVGPAEVATRQSFEGTILAAKNALVASDSIQTGLEIAEQVIEATADYIETYDGYYQRALSAANDVYQAARECRSAYVELLAAECAVETVVAEAERVIDERTLARQQSADALTRTRYNDMFFRLVRNNALSRYDAQFELAQKYVYLAAQAYDYETGLLSSDRASGDAFMARIIGTRTLGEFTDDGDPIVASDAVKGDGGLAAILAEMDENWQVLKPRLGINNPQPYATWFSLRHDLFRIYDGEKGDKEWRTTLRKYIVEDLNQISEFRHYCQPLAGSTAEKEPGFVIPFPTLIAQGYNFFGEELEGGDASLDPTWFATHISSAGIHFVGYDDENLSRTPTAYLVPVGEDRMRAVGDPDTVLSWKVIDQTIPAPYAIGSTQLDDPDWTPLYDGATGGNDVGARIRKHPSFRAYYDEAGKDPDDESLDCTRLVGRSAWNTKWLLIIPASSMSADREAAIATFISGIDSDRDGDLDSTGVSDIKIGLKTYSTSGN